MQIIVDSREHLPFTFEHGRYADVQIQSGTLNVGDYSLCGLEDKVAVERKSLPDLVACLGRERQRFEKELQRSMALDAFAVVQFPAELPDLDADLARGLQQNADALGECASVVRHLLHLRGREWSAAGEGQ